MDETEFNLRVDDILTRIDDALDEFTMDIDCEEAGGILTLSFANGSKIIVNRQTPLKQIWVAAKSGGYHFIHDTETDFWRDDNNGEELFSALSRFCSQQAGSDVKLAQN